MCIICEYYSRNAVSKNIKKKKNLVLLQSRMFHAWFFMINAFFALEWQVRSDSLDHWLHPSRSRKNPLWTGGCCMRTSRVWAGDQMSTGCVGMEEEDQQEMVDLWTTHVPFEVSSERCNSTISRFKNGIKKLHDDDLENSLTAYVCLSCGMLLQDYSLCCHLWSCLCFLLFYFCVFNSAFSLIMVWYPLWIRKKN